MRKDLNKRLAKSTEVEQRDLAWQRVAYARSPAGYERAGLVKDMGRVRVLTPPSTLRVLEAGYRPWVHPSVMRA